MGRPTSPYYETPDVPWCVLGKVSWGVVQAVKVPEHLAPYYVGKHGWKILIRDSEFPVPINNSGTMPALMTMQSNPVRRKYDRWMERDAWHDNSA